MDDVNRHHYYYVNNAADHISRYKPTVTLVNTKKKSDYLLILCFGLLKDVRLSIQFLY